MHFLTFALLLALATNSIQHEQCIKNVLKDCSQKENLNYDEMIIIWKKQAFPIDNPNFVKFFDCFQKSIGFDVNGQYQFQKVKELLPHLLKFRTNSTPEESIILAERVYDICTSLLQEDPTVIYGIKSREEGELLNVTQTLYNCIKRLNLDQNEMMIIWRQKVFPVDNTEFLQLVDCFQIDTGLSKNNEFNFEKWKEIALPMVMLKTGKSLEEAREYFLTVVNTCGALPKQESSVIQGINVRNCVYNLHKRGS